MIEAEVADDERHTAVPASSQALDSGGIETGSSLTPPPSRSICKPLSAVVCGTQVSWTPSPVNSARKSVGGAMSIRTGRDSAGSLQKPCAP